MSFPTNPNVGDTFTFEDTVFKFNGVTWDRIIIGRANATDYSGHTLVTTALIHRIAHLEALLDNQFLILD